MLCHAVHLHGTDSIFMFHLLNQEGVTHTPCLCVAATHLAVLCHAALLQGVTSWFVFYLIKEKGVADAAQAAVRVSGLELGGLVGSLIAGRLSDMMINNSKQGEGAVGKRVQVGVLIVPACMLRCTCVNVGMYAVAGGGGAAVAETGCCWSLLLRLVPLLALFLRLSAAAASFAYVCGIDSGVLQLLGL
jgi:hypothetical protein